MSTVERTTVEVPPVEVTLLEDRAHVTRRARLRLGAATHRLRIDGVAPVLADKTLGARIAAVSGARVHDVRVRRERIVTREGRPEEVRELDREIDDLFEAYGRLANERTGVAQRLGGVAQALELLIGEIAEDTAWGRLDEKTAQQRLGDLGEREQSLRARIVGMDAELRRITERIERLRARRGQAENPGTRATACIELELTADVEGEHELVVTYVVPGACWRPQHTARLTSDAGKTHLHFECQGCVWQSTGETWKDVKLTMSTERASLGLEPPRLQSDVLAVQRKAKQLVVEVREQEVQQAQVAAVAGSERQVPAPVAPGIDDGGEARQLVAPAPTTIPPDGRPHRVPLFAFDAEAETELVLMAELAPAVILRSVQRHRGAQPILAGPVDLIREAGFVGRTKVLFVAPGDRFELGWGPEGALRVQREIEPLKDESNFIGTWTTRAQDVKVRISNLGAVPRAMRVVERVLVSEIEKVQVSVDREKTSGGKQPDADGFVTWNVNVAGNGHEMVVLRYAVKQHSDVRGG